MSLRTTYGRTYVSTEDYEDWLLLVDHRDRLLSVCLEMFRVSDAWRSHSRTTFGVTCTDFTVAIFSMGH